MTLGDVCYITDGAHAKVERQVSGIMYLTSKNIGDGKLKLDNFDFISESSFQSYLRIQKSTKEVTSWRCADGNHRDIRELLFIQGNGLLWDFKFRCNTASGPK